MKRLIRTGLCFFAILSVLAFSFCKSPTSSDPQSDEAITILAIPDIQAPAVGGVPVTSIVTDQYTGTVTWSPDHNFFQAEEEYTATITLKAKAPYTLAGVNADSFTIAGAPAGTTITHAAGSGVITVVFPITSTGEDELITLLAIPGIQAPAIGRNPVTSIETHEYKGTITWSPAHDTFQAVEYTATITLTVKTPYTLAGVKANSFTIAGAPEGTTVTHAAGSNIITVVFPIASTVILIPLPTNSFTVTNDIKAYNGREQGASVAYIEGITEEEAGEFLVYYSGDTNTDYLESEIEPIYIGIYDISVETNGGLKYLPLEKKKIGTLTITARTLTIIPASGQKKEYNQSDPVFTYTVDGEYVEAEDRVSGALTRQEGEAVGTYNFLIGSVSVNKDYYILGLDTSVKFTIEKAGGAALAGDPTTALRTSTSITINEIPKPSSEQTVEYAIQETDTIDASAAWQTGLTFTGLKSGTSYYIFARSAENNNYKAGPPRMGSGSTLSIGDVAIMTITLGPIQDETLTFTPDLPSSGILVLTRGGPTVTLTLSDAGSYSSVKWTVQKPTEDSLITETSASITLDPDVFWSGYSMTTIHYLTVTVTIGTAPDIVPYSKIIPISVEP